MKINKEGTGTILVVSAFLAVVAGLLTAFVSFSSLGLYILWGATFVYHFATYGEPVDVDVKKVHENRHLHHLLATYLGLHNVFAYNHYTVARRVDQVGVGDMGAGRLAEECHYNGP